MRGRDRHLPRRPAGGAAVPVASRRQVSPDGRDPTARRSGRSWRSPPDDATELSMGRPGPIRLELGSATVAGGGAGRPIGSGPRSSREGNLASRSPPKRPVLVWTDAARGASVVTRDQRTARSARPALRERSKVVLRAGATGRRAHRERSTRSATSARSGSKAGSRHFACSPIAARARAAAPGASRPTRDATIHGAVIHAPAACRWAAERRLAVMASGYRLDTDARGRGLRVDRGQLRGQRRRAGARLRVRATRRAGSTTGRRLPATVFNATVASGTCLLRARRRRRVRPSSEGFAGPARLTPRRRSTVALDSPLGSLARGHHQIGARRVLAAGRAVPPVSPCR
jgi:hypothetical protein